MKRILSIAGLVLSVFIFLEGCSSSKQQNNEESTLKEKETFTFDEIKSDSSAPLPIDSVAVENESEDIKKSDLPSVKTRKKSVDSQETPAPVVTNKKSVSTSEVPSKTKTEEKPDIAEKPLVQNTIKGGQYIVQLGAFQSVDNAKEFIKLNRSKIKQELNIHFSDRVKLYQIQLQPVDSRVKAQNLVKDLKKRGYKDAFVVQSFE